MNEKHSNHDLLFVEEKKHIDYLSNMIS